MTERDWQQQERAQSRALTKQQQNEIVAPTTVQPAYPVPEADLELRNAQTASWDTSQEIVILRYCMAKESQKDGGNPNTIMGLTRAIDTMIARNQSTALKCGAYLNREASSDFIKVLIHIACEAVMEHAPDHYEPIIDDMRARLEPYFDPAAIAAVNARYEK